jgi:RecJ-like exonuclease
MNQGLNTLKNGDFFKGDVKIIRKAKPGPVVFIVTNGLGAVEAVIKDSEFNVSDVVYIEGYVNEHKGRTQIEIQKISKSNFDFEAILSAKSAPTRTNFSISSDRFEKMKPEMVKIASKIRSSILKGQPIMIRHHNDSDGVISGLSLELSCLSFMQEQGIDPKFLLFRSPSKAPYYSSGDVLRDLVLSKRFVEEDSKMKPLIIIADNGSTPEDSLGLSILATLGYECIVIDHHNPVEINENGETSVDMYLVAHLNPYKVGLDSKTSAGMLCYEIGRMVSATFENHLFPAVAGISDRCDIQETEDYISKTKMQRQELSKIGTSIDYISFQLKHDAGKGVFEQLFENQKFVEIIYTEVGKGFETQLQSSLPYLRSQEINGVVFSTIDLLKYTMRFTFPAPGAVLSRIHEVVNSEKIGNPCLTVGIVEDMFIIRANQKILPVQEIIDYLKTKYPEANVDGGGHEMAGAIRFISAHSEKLLEEIKTMLKNRSLNQ